MTKPRRVTHRLEAWVLRRAVWLLRRLGPVRSSNLGGWLARSVGPFLPVSKVADANLRLALPDLDQAARTRIVRDVWDNLGRTAAEFPHLARFDRTAYGPGWEIEGKHHVDALTQGGKPVLFVSGHFGNWEMILAIGQAVGLRLAGMYRAASNPEVDRLIQAMRREAIGPDVAMFPKGSTGARAALLSLAQGGSLGLLIDQKMNDGIAVPFFGHPAMTAPALAQFALRFDLPIIPVRTVRRGPARFRMICEPALAVPLTGDRTKDVYAISLAMNATLERWIRSEPGAWLWLHRRWPKDATAS